MKIEVLSLIVESVLAVAALIIAVLQLVGEQRERNTEAEKEREQENEKAGFMGILDKLNEMDFAVVSEAINNINSIAEEARQGKKVADPNNVVKIFDDALDKYKESYDKNKDALKELYRILLFYEDRFPMAHGYGRYIEDLREILNYEGLERKIRIVGYYQARLEYYFVLNLVWNQKGGRIEESDAIKLGNLTEKMVQGLEPVLVHADRIENLMNELHYKYDKYKTDAQN